MSASGAGARRLLCVWSVFPFFFNRLARRFSGAPPGVVEASMSELRAIDVSDYAPLKLPEQAGAAPQLMWLKIAMLGVDESYQREITEDGRTKVRRIAAAFDWDCFGPVVVSPVARGLYAIVDGQHRTTAALLCGFDSVPCSVILADRRKQAKAFDAINGTITRVTPAQRFRAMVAAGDAEALRIDAVLTRAGVRVRTSVGGRQQRYAKPGDTFAFAAIRRAVLRHGDAAAELALRCILASAKGESGWLGAATIRAISQVLGARPEWHKWSRLEEAFRGFSVDEAVRAASAEAAARKGVAAVDLLRARVTTVLAAFFETAPAAAAPAPAPAKADVPAMAAVCVRANARIGRAAPPAVAAPDAAPGDGLTIDGYYLPPAEAALVRALLENVSLTRKAILAATRDGVPVALDARDESAADELVRDLRRRIGRLGVAILLRGNAYLIELPAKARLRGLIARARGAL